MTLKMILSSRPEIAKVVRERYPKSKRERQGCQTEIAKRDYMRWMCAKRLLEEEQREKVEYDSGAI